MRWLAFLLHAVANRLYDGGHRERFDVVDEYGILRCRVEIAGDDSHGIDFEFDQLPDGWEVRTSGVRYY